MVCPICDSWNKTPHAKRFTTPIPPQYAEETLVIGYWLGINQPADPDHGKGLCEKHKKIVLAFDTQEKKRAAPTIPPPGRIPLSQIVASIQTGKELQNYPSQPTAQEIQAILRSPQDASAQENIRSTFLGIAEACAAEFIRQHPTSVQPQAVDPSPQDTPDVYRQALVSIVKNSKDSEAVEFATKVLQGVLLPSLGVVEKQPQSIASNPQPPNEAPTSGAFPCPLCSKVVKPGEVHSC